MELIKYINKGFRLSSVQIRQIMEDFRSEMMWLIDRDQLH